MTPHQALTKCIDLLRGPSNAARAIGEKQQHVSAQLNRAKRAAPHCCIRYENAVNGEVTRYELRPDVFGPPPTIEELERQLATLRRRRDSAKRARRNGG